MKRHIFVLLVEAGGEEHAAGAWAAAGAGGAGCAPRAAAASKGNHSRETSPETKKPPTFNFLTTAFLPELFILATAHSINEIFNQLTSVPAHMIFSAVHFFKKIFILF